jgi:biotin transport system substrate-specific component
MKKKFSVQQLTLTGMFSAIAVITSLFSLPMPNGVAVTLQTFGMALIGYVLGPSGIWSVLVWILLGLVGLPVFSGFQGGIGVLAGFTGGFIIGFPFMTVLCGLGSRARHPLPALALGLAGLCITHLCGILQYMNLAELDFFAAALIMSIPYLLKDIASVAAAFAVGMAVKKRLPQERSVPERL